MADIEWKGSGAEQDPWLVESIEHLLTMRSKRSSDDTKYFKLTTDLDFNNYKNGIFNSTIGFGNIVFDGDGHTIRNINNVEEIGGGNLRDKGLFEVTEAEIKNTNFEALNSDSKPIFRHWSGNNKDGYMRNCNISCKCKHFNYYYGSRDLFHIEDSTISILSDGDAMGYDNSENYNYTDAGYKFMRCHIKMHMTKESTINMYNMPTFNYCKVEIDNVKKTGSDNRNKVTDLYSVFLFDAVDKDTTAGMYFGETCIFDSTLWGNANADSLCKGLTTEQLKSAEELHKVGFPVVAE